MVCQRTISNKEPQNFEGEKKHLLAAAVLILLGMLVYANTLNVPFYLDDFRNIADNHAIQFTHLSLKGLAKAAFGGPAPNRPVANLSFAANYYFHGKAPAGYHLVNIGVHILAGLLLFSLVHATLATPALLNRYLYPAALAFFAAALWLVHPLQTQSVTYIVQRMNSLAAMFCILSLFCYVRGRLVAASSRRSWPWFSGAAIAFILALGSKEISAILPGLIVLYEWYFFQDLNWSWLKRHLLLVGGCLVLLVLLALLYTHGNIWHQIAAAYQHRRFTLPQRLLTELRVVIFYLGLFFYPHPSRLSLDHDFAISESFLSPSTTLASAAAIVLLLAAALVLARRERLLSFAILWLLANLVIESSAVGLEIIFEHRMYLPSMFGCAALAGLVWRFVRPPWLTAAALSALLAVLCLWTWQRNELWRHPVQFWTDAVRQAPAKARPYNNLGVELRKEGRFAEAIAASLQALAIEPDFVNAHVSLGMAYDGAGFIDKAIVQFQRALALEPEYGGVYVNLGNSYIKKGEIEAAIIAFGQALEQQPDNIAARVNLAAARAVMGQFVEVVDELEKARELDPANPDIYYNLGLAYRQTGQYQKARQAFSEALRRRPDDPASAGQLRLLPQETGTLGN